MLQAFEVVGHLVTRENLEGAYTQALDQCRAANLGDLFEKKKDDLPEETRRQLQSLLEDTAAIKRSGESSGTLESPDLSYKP